MPDPIPIAEVLREALRSRHKESFERSLGRAVRHLGGDYKDYLAVIQKVREYGSSHNLDLRAAATVLSDQS
ncbi:MAG: hypothetical protein L3J78_02570 [Thermoplasmata archaeon]|nr:hypothetical protein [Thermoplasmata archaeon]